MISVGHILIVENDKAIREFLNDLLSSEGYQVTIAPNNNKNYEIGIAPDIILFDIDASTYLWQSIINAYCCSVTHHIPIIGMSTSTKSQQHTQTFGSDITLQKPFDLDELLICIKKYLPGYAINLV
jgi:DNA-binding response OmpR family regulator